MLKLISSADIKAATKGAFSDDFDLLLEDLIIPQACELLAEECNRPDFDKKSRSEYFSPLRDQRTLFLSSPPIALPTSVRTADLRWVLSPVAGNNIYYVEKSSGGDPAIANPGVLEENAVAMTRGSSIGALTAGQFAYGNVDGLGFRTIYARLSDNTDPDSKAAGYLSADPIRIYQSTDNPRVWDATTLVDSTEYFIEAEEGTIERQEFAYWPRGIQTVRVTYTGGYVVEDAQDVPAGLRGAALYQSKIIFDRREELSVQNRSLEGGSITMLTPITLPHFVKHMLRPYRLARI